jgi:hypothetical protein
MKKSITILVIIMLGFINIHSFIFAEKYNFFEDEPIITSSVSELIFF